MQGDFRPCRLDSVHSACASQRDTPPPAMHNLGRGRDFGRGLVVPPVVGTKPPRHGGLIGARLYFVVQSGWYWYLTHPLHIVQ
jgi:hypothetical protein